ncbi:hypothetical protein OH809_15965 [Streptomyces sp. NBC_00873]|uniref:hypothetical protein n=1 Tax=unclassified Streptomyces TaxID=2593676 RepID=UPI0038632955|nr:hypothetical protein OH809_15965 [Streptomyces sp. NBC_00873]WTA45949.1 hypothetical protein OH821_27720 [Streptomyces sp. NBC_00842]
MTSARRAAAALIGATVLVLTPALAGCGKGRTPSAGPTSAAPVPVSASATTATAPTTPAAASTSATTAAGSPPVGASPYQEPGTVDGAPHYKENHAFQQARELSPAERAEADARAARIKEALTPAAQDPHTTESRIRKVLTGLGYASGVITTSSWGHDNAYLIDNGPICLEGVVYVSVDGAGHGQVTAEAHGRYIEGTGCVKPEGGH